MPELSRTMRAALSGAFCFIVLAGMLVRHAWPLMTGAPIYLEVIGRDPRDLFRGDYVVLSYPIERLVVRPAGAAPRDVGIGVVIVEPLGAWWDEIASFSNVDFYTRTDWMDRILYLQLEPEPSTAAGVPQVHKARSVSDAPVAGKVNLKGRLTMLSRLENDDPAADVEIGLHYGIDAIYVQQGTGPLIEDAIRVGTVHALVSVTSSGSARLSDLVIDGQPWSSIRAGE